MIQQVSVFVDNKAGMACAIMETLAKAKINARAMMIADSAEFGIVRLIVNDAQAAVDALHEGGFAAKLTDVIGFTIPDKSGALCNVMWALGGRGVNIEYSYTLMGNKQGSADIVIRVKDTEKAESILREAGIKMITLSDIL